MQRHEAAERRAADGRVARDRAVARVDQRLQLLEQHAAVRVRLAAGLALRVARRRVLVDARGAGVVDADDDHRRRRPLVDRLVRGLGEAPVLPRHEGALRLEEVLPVLHVEDGIARRLALAVAGREVDRDDARKLREVLERPAADASAAVLETEDALQRGPEGTRRHQRRISRYAARK